MQMIWLVFPDQEYNFLWLLVRCLYLDGREWYLNSSHSYRITLF